MNDASVELGVRIGGRKGWAGNLCGWGEKDETLTIPITYGRGMPGKVITFEDDTFDTAMVAVRSSYYM